MKLRRSLLLLFLLLVADDAARAQGKTSLFSAPLTVSTGLENVPGPDGSLVPESTLLITPVRPLFTKDTARTTFRLSYSPEFEFVRNGNRDLTFWNHAADFAYGHTSGHRTRFTLGHSYVRSSDPSRLFQDSLFVLARNNFRQNATVVAARHDFTRRSSLGARFDNTITRISSPNRLDGTYLNGYGVAGTVSMTRHISERQKFTGSYSVLKFSPFQFPSNGDAATFLSTLPTIRAGISRFAMTIGLSSAEAATTPSGMLGGSRTGNPTGSPVAPEAPATPGIGAPVIGPIAGIDSLNSIGPASAGLSPSPKAVHSEFVESGASSATATTASSSSKSPTGLFVATASASPANPFSHPKPATLQNEMSLLGDPFHVVAGTYTYQRGRGLLFELSGGVMTDYAASYLMGAQMEKTSNRLWMSLGFQHFLSYYGPIPLTGIAATSLLGLPPGTRAQSRFSVATFIVNTKITRRTELEVSTSVSRSTANFVEHHVRSLVGSARINHWLTDKFGLFVSADSVSEDRVQTGASAFNRQRYLGGFQIRMSPPRSTRPEQR